jgi:hypothetical protein
MNAETHIMSNFPIGDEEYKILDKKFIKLCHFQAWQLDKSSKSGNFNDQEDYVQDLRFALLKAGSYYKRQTYIENCFFVLKKYLKDDFLRAVLDELVDLWNNKTKHGANKQKFGDYQEKTLEKLLMAIPEENRPDKNRHLEMDSRFVKYAKNITWNTLKLSAKRSYKDNILRRNSISLSEFEYMVG